MAADEQKPSSAPSVPTVQTALETIGEAVRGAQAAQPPQPPDSGASAEQALAALVLLREVRGQLADWETGLVEAAREAGASWADLAHPLGVASRQAAERRYLRLRPGVPGSTGEERIQATRERRAADRTITAWARDNAADLRQLAGQLTALPDLPAEARTPLTQALGGNDAAALIDPLTRARHHLTDSHPEFAARIDALGRHTGHIRTDSADQP